MHRVSDVRSAIGIFPLHLLVNRVASPRRHAVRERPELVPRREGAIRWLDHVTEVGVDFHRVEVGRVAAEICRAELRLRPLIHIVESPVLPIHIKVGVHAVAADLAHRELRETPKFIGHEEVAAVATEAPRVVLGSAKIEFVEAGCRRGIAAK